MTGWDGGYKALPDGTHRKYVYDLDGRIITERDELNQPVRETIFVDGHPVAEMVGTPGSTTIRYIHTDQIGLPRLMTDALGAVTWDSAFMPFGEQVSATGSTSTDHRFQGQLADTHASLYYNYFRDYDPTLGRYIQSDPIGLDGGLNRFAYAKLDPLFYIDPDGSVGLPGAAGGAVTNIVGQLIVNRVATGSLKNAIACLDVSSVLVAGATGFFLPGFFATINSPSWPKFVSNVKGFGKGLGLKLPVNFGLHAIVPEYVRRPLLNLPYFEGCDCSKAGLFGLAGQLIY